MTKKQFLVVLLVVAIFILCLPIPKKVHGDGVSAVAKPEAFVTISAQPTIPIPVLSTVTAYSSLDSCNTAKCLMASGKSAYVGAVACPYSYKLGTKVKIRGTIYTCEDRTAKRFNGRFDIFMGYGIEGHRKAIAWGIQKVEVQVVSMVK